jgi:hypothetical protein
MSMQRLTSEYRASLILAATNAGVSADRRETPQSVAWVGGRRSSDRADHPDLDEYRDLGDFDADLDYRDLSGADYDPQPAYWYWSYDHPDAGI